MAWHDMTWHGSAWNGMEQHEIWFAWHGMELHGMLCHSPGWHVSDLVDTLRADDHGAEAAGLAPPEEAELGGHAGEAEPALGDRGGQALGELYTSGLFNRVFHRPIFPEKK